MMNDLERQARLRDLHEDNRAAKALAAAHSSLLRALEAIPNSVYSAFAIPQDVRAIEAATQLVAPVLGDAEIAIQKHADELDVVP